MLQKLIINNYAIIDHLVLEPDHHLNTVTGETGAGKSIILGALSLILGDRADTSVLINKSQKSVVEGYFDVSSNSAFRQALADAELDNEEQCIIRREIAVNGKSRAFINDTPVTLTVLNQLTSLLVDLHQQFGHLALEDDGFTTRSIDAVCGCADLAVKYLDTFIRHKKVKKELTDNTSRQAEWQKEADYKQYLFDELINAAFKPNEIEDAAIQLKQMTHAERIIQVINGARIVLDEGEQPIINELKRMAQQLQGISDLVPALAPLAARISSSWAELKDISEELEAEHGNISLDPGQMEQLQERIDLGYKLLKKHGLPDTAALLQLQNRLDEDLKATSDINNAIEKLALEEEKLRKEMLDAGNKLSAARKNGAAAFTEKMNHLLTLVGMPNARFDIHIAAGAPTALGIDNIQFMLDANKSGQFQPVQKAASGGEMSRIMLCIKSLTARALHMPTLIFDEVDTGISGEAARQVGLLLRELSLYHQVICITHQPQVAARGTRHFYVYKQADKQGRLATGIKVLEPAERVLAIARMIGGEQPSEAAMNNARELVAI